MIELLSNCSHGSETAVYSVDDADGKIIRKVASSEFGIASLKRELQGWTWYQSRRYANVERSMCRKYERDGYFRIDIDWIEGRKWNYRKGLIRNGEVIDRAVKHYCSIWPKGQKECIPIHGDLSVDNFIINSEGIHFIDWEHFDGEGGPWGFDPIYLIFESLWFGMKGRSHPTKKEILLIIGFLRILRETQDLLDSLFYTPLRTIKCFLLENEAIWGNQLRCYPQKFPVLNFALEQVERIDREVGQALG